MVTGKRSIEQLLRIPEDLKPGQYWVHCSALIGTSGWVLSVRCYSKSAGTPASLLTAVSYATRSSLFVPAQHAGKPIDVYIVLMVMLDTSLGEPMILAVPNNGIDTGRYGLLYTAPQRYGGHQVTAPYRPRYNSPLRRAIAWTRMNVDEHGVVTDFSVTADDEGASETLAEAVRQAVPKMTFIPGHHEGKPAPMGFVDPIVWIY